MKTRKLITLCLMAFALMFASCDNDEGSDDAPPYVGEWETNTFPFVANGAPVDAKMDFTFEEFSFLDEVKVVIGGIEVPSMGVKGEVEPKGANTLHIKIKELGSPNNSGGYDWKAYEDDLTNQALVSAFMPQEFDAEYEIEGTRMDLIIPVAKDTIVMFKK